MTKKHIKEVEFEHYVPDPSGTRVSAKRFKSSPEMEIYKEGDSVHVGWKTEALSVPYHRVTWAIFSGDGRSQSKGSPARGRKKSAAAREHALRQAAVRQTAGVRERPEQDEGRSVQPPSGQELRDHGDGSADSAPY
ncbi:MAG: hypothetical protein GY871_09450, partial [Actinomycetales bacterium]|nr:hypothetical protein [Actinomycetales bacterium]